MEEGFGLVPASVGSFLSSVTLCSQLCYSIQSNPIQGITSLFTPNQPFDFLSGLVVKPSFLLVEPRKGSLCGVPHFQPEKAVKSESGHYSAPDTKPLYYTTTYIHTRADFAILACRESRCGCGTWSRVESSAGCLSWGTAIPSARWHALQTGTCSSAEVMTTRYGLRPRDLGVLGVTVGRFAVCSSLAWRASLVFGGVLGHSWGLNVIQPSMEQQLGLLVVRRISLLVHDLAC